LDATRSDRNVDSSNPRRFTQKRRFSRIGLYEFDTRDPEDCEDKAGEPRPAAKIDQISCRLRHKAVKLRRIEDVPSPEIGDRVTSDEVYAGRPLGQQRGIGLEPGECFT
jgi:hypothetical protein